MNQYRDIRYDTIYRAIASWYVSRPLRPGPQPWRLPMKGLPGWVDIANHGQIVFQNKIIKGKF